MSEKVKVGWGNQRVIENSEMCGDLAVSEATHSPLSEPRGELGSGTGQQVWEPMLGLYGECGRESLVVFEGPQISVCPRVAYCPRVSEKQEDRHTPVVFHPQFPGNTSRSQAEMPGLVPGPAVLLSNSPSLQGILSRGVFVGMSSPLSPACSQEGDLTGQKNLVPWEYELLASAPGPL